MKITRNKTEHSNSVEQSYEAGSFMLSLEPRASVLTVMEIWRIFEVKHWENTVS